MIERYVYSPIRKIEDPTLRTIADTAARLVFENWFYVAAVIVLWRFPYVIADLTDTEVMPRRPTGDSAFWQSEMARALVLACLAMSYNLLFGFSGIISFGHALFFGAGGYITFILMNEYDPSLQGKALIAVLFIALCAAVFTKVSARTLLTSVLVSVLLVLVLLPDEGSLSFFQAAGIAVAISVVISLVSGVVTLRLRGIYFAMFTLALAEMFWVLAKSGTFRDYTGAEDGLGFRDVLPESLNPTPTFDGSRLDMYRITVVFFVIVFLAIRRYLNSPVGRVMLAIRENEERARTIGYNTLFYKVLTMIFAGIIATLSGLLFVIWATDKRVHPEILSLKYTVDPLLNTLIGGVGTLTGPVVATLGLSLGETYLRNETFTLYTSVLGVIKIWQVLVVFLAGVVMWALRRYLSILADWAAERVRPENPIIRGTSDYRRFRRLFFGAVFVILVIAGLVIGSQVYTGPEANAKVYQVADLWELFLGILFVIVVMVLPNGIVGTWNRIWAERRIRQIEQEIQKTKDAPSD